MITAESVCSQKLHSTAEYLRYGGRVDMLDKYFIEFCSPTLAGIKTASLFNCPFDSAAELGKSLYRWNTDFAQKGLKAVILRMMRKRALIYLYRITGLKSDLQDEQIAGFLHSYGYCGKNMEDSLRILQKKMRESDDFPHEIGIFLGYPLEDVIGFIENEGRNSRCVGCWKVYGDECAARRTFAKFRACKNSYERQWSKGKTVLQLTVAA